jgi:hypothetical protein
LRPQNFEARCRHSPYTPIRDGPGCYNLPSLKKYYLILELLFNFTEKHLVFPLVYKLIELTLILPTSTTSVERAFSAMNIIKSKLRKINDEWFNDLMICYTERNIFKSFDDVNIIRTFTTSKT